MKKSLRIEPAVFDRLGSLPKAERDACWLALADLLSAFGRPHVHTGLSIRKLTPRTFECRGSLAWRFIFEDAGQELRIRLLVNHDEIRRMLRSGQLG